MHAIATSGPASSPRTWGCTEAATSEEPAPRVVPTHVGVHRTRARRRASRSGRPHARGGAPHARDASQHADLSSPRTWGCTGPGGPPQVRQTRRPHARGGAPPTSSPGSRTPRSSPRTWGCTGDAARRLHRGAVVPTHVGVHRGIGRREIACNRRPHARGGAPERRQCPRSRSSVVPTHVGVHRRWWLGRRERRESSPRTWGCTVEAVG